MVSRAIGTEVFQRLAQVDFALGIRAIRDNGRTAHVVDELAITLDFPL